MGVWQNLIAQEKTETFMKQDKKSLKVLMIGNSFSICVLNHMPAIAAECGCELDLVSMYIGGCSMERHAGNLYAGKSFSEFRPYRIDWSYSSLKEGEKVPFEESLYTERYEENGEKKERWWGNIPALLRGDEWDIVTIQQASHESWNAGSYHPWADLLIKEIREAVPKAKIYVQQTWSYCKMDARICGADGGVGSWGFDQVGMYERLTENYEKLANENNLEMIPTGKAVQMFREQMPVRAVEEDIVGRKWVFADGREGCDSIHLNGRGEYLQGCVWVERLFGVDVRKVADKGRENVPGTEEERALMRSCAHEACR